MNEEKPSQKEKELLGRIGLKLRAAREAKGITLQEVSSITRIHLNFLKKIEFGETDELPGLAFVRGFIRNFLQVLELKDEEIEADLREMAGTDRFIKESSFGTKITGFHTDDEPTNMKRILIIAGVGLVVILGLYIIYTIFSRPDAEPVTKVESAVEEQAEPEPAAEQPEEQQPPAEEQPEGEPAEQQAESPPDADAAGTVEAVQPEPEPKPQKQAETSALPGEPRNILKLTVRGLEPTWLRISIDRAAPVEIKLDPAETMDWEANEEIRLTIGKSHGVAVYLNGEDILLPEERNRLIPSIVLNRLTLLRLEN